MQDDDEELLQNNIVDFVSFSYYGSRLTSADPEKNTQTASNLFSILRNPYLKLSFSKVKPLTPLITSEKGHETQSIIRVID